METFSSIKLLFWRTATIVAATVTIGVCLFVKTSALPPFVAIAFSTVTLLAYEMYLLKVNRGLVWVDVLVLYPPLFWLYSFTFPFLNGLFNIRFLSIPQEVVNSVSMSLAVTLAVFCGVVAVVSDAFDRRAYRDNPVFHLSEIGDDHIFLEDILALACFGMYALRFFQAGGFAVTSMSRSQVFKAMSESSFWMIKIFIAIYTGVVVMDYFSGKHTRSRLRTYLRFGICTGFWGVSLIVGSRRELLWVLLFVAQLAFVRSTNKPVSLRTRLLRISAVVVLVGGLLSMAYFRVNSYSISNISAAAVFENVFGEFAIPVNTLYYYTYHPAPPMYGTSIFRSYLYVFPSFLLGTLKPVSLGTQFMMDAHQSIGFAFTPMTEMYLNFRGFGYVIYPILAAILLIRVRHRVGNSIMYTLLITQSVNFQRSEFGTFVIESLIMLLSLWFISELRRTRIAFAHW